MGDSPLKVSPGPTRPGPSAAGHGTGWDRGTPTARLVGAPGGDDGQGMGAMGPGGWVPGESGGFRARFCGKFGECLVCQRGFVGGKGIENAGFHRQL